MKGLQITFTEVKPMTKEEKEAFQRNHPNRYREVVRMMKRLAKLYPDLNIDVKEL